MYYSVYPNQKNEGLQIRNGTLGIYLVNDSRGRSSGEAFVQFCDSEQTDLAMKRNREKIGQRWGVLQTINNRNNKDLLSYTNALKKTRGRVGGFPRTWSPIMTKRKPNAGGLMRILFGCNSNLTKIMVWWIKKLKKGNHVLILSKTNLSGL